MFSDISSATWHTKLRSASSSNLLVGVPTVINIISRDKRIGDSHMNVPGHDGKKGFGGACFPKDSLALIKFAKNLNVDLNSLISTVKINNKIRSEYNDIDSRESEQNVSFDDKI